MTKDNLTREARSRITPEQKTWLLRQREETGNSESTIIRQLINEKIQDHE